MEFKYCTKCNKKADYYITNLNTNTNFYICSSCLMKARKPKIILGEKEKNG